MSDTSPHANEAHLLERISQLEIERDDYKAYTVATMNGYHIRQAYDGRWYYCRGEDGAAENAKLTWYLAARAAMKEVCNAAAVKAAEYLEGTK